MSIKISDFITITQHKSLWMSKEVTRLWCHTQKIHSTLKVINFLISVSSNHHWGCVQINVALINYIMLCLIMFKYYHSISLKMSMGYKEEKQQQQQQQRRHFPTEINYFFFLDFFLIFWRWISSTFFNYFLFLFIIFITFSVISIELL